MLEEVEESVLDVEALRRCRDCVSGGLDLSFFTGSTSTAFSAGRRFEDDLCSPPTVAGLLIFARGGGAREALLMLPVTLGGREIREGAGGFMGRRDGDWDARSGRRTVFRSLGSKAGFSYLEGLRREREREGMADMLVVLWLFVDSDCTGRFLLECWSEVRG